MTIPQIPKVTSVECCLQVLVIFVFQIYLELYRMKLVKSLKSSNEHHHPDMQ